MIHKKGHFSLFYKNFDKEWVFLLVANKA